MGGLAFLLVTQTWQYGLLFLFSLGNGLALFGLILVGTVFAYTVFLKGTSLIGAVKGSLLTSVEPVASVIFIVLILNDIFNMIFIIGAVIFIFLKDLLMLKKNEFSEERT